MPFNFKKTWKQGTDDKTREIKEIKKNDIMKRARVAIQPYVQQLQLQLQQEQLQEQLEQEQLELQQQQLQLQQPPTITQQQQQQLQLQQLQLQQQQLQLQQQQLQQQLQKDESVPYAKKMSIFLQKMRTKKEEKKEKEKQEEKEKPRVQEKKIPCIELIKLIEDNEIEENLKKKFTYLKGGIKYTQDIDKPCEDLVNFILDTKKKEHLNNLILHFINLPEPENEKNRKNILDDIKQFLQENPKVYNLRFKNNQQKWITPLYASIYYLKDRDIVEILLQNCYRIKDIYDPDRDDNCVEKVTDTNKYVLLSTEKFNDKLKYQLEDIINKRINELNKLIESADCSDIINEIQKANIQCIKKYIQDNEFRHIMEGKESYLEIKNKDGKSLVQIAVSSQNDGRHIFDIVKILLEAGETKICVGSPGEFWNIVETNTNIVEEYKQEILSLARNTCKLVEHIINPIKPEDQSDFMGWYLKTLQSIVDQQHICINLKCFNILNNFKIEPLVNIFLRRLIKSDENEKNGVKILRIFSQNKNFNINIQDNDGDAPLHLAISLNYLIISSWLLSEAAINVNIQNNNGTTPLHIAVDNAQSTLTQVLLQQSYINVNIQDNKGNTALHIAVKELGNNLKMTTSEKVVKIKIYIIYLLLRVTDIDLNIQNKDGNTALHIAVMFEKWDPSQWNTSHVLEKNNMDIINLLLNQDRINVQIKNNQGKTALNIFCDNYLNDNKANEDQFFNYYWVSLRHFVDKGAIILDNIDVFEKVFHRSPAGIEWLNWWINEQEKERAKERAKEKERAASGVVNVCQESPLNAGRFTWNEDQRIPVSGDGNCLFYAMVYSFNSIYQQLNEDNRNEWKQQVRTNLNDSIVDERHRDVISDLEKLFSRYIEPSSFPSENGVNNGEFGQLLREILVYWTWYNFSKDRDIAVGIISSEEFKKFFLKEFYFDTSDANWKNDDENDEERKFFINTYGEENFNLAKVIHQRSHNIDIHTAWQLVSDVRIGEKLYEFIWRQLENSFNDQQDLLDKKFIDLLTEQYVELLEQASSSHAQKILVNFDNLTIRGIFGEFLWYFLQNIPYIYGENFHLTLISKIFNTNIEIWSCNLHRNLINRMKVNNPSSSRVACVYYNGINHYWSLPSYVLDPNTIFPDRAEIVQLARGGSKKMIKYNKKTIKNINKIHQQNKILSEKQNIKQNKKTIKKNKKNIKRKTIKHKI